MELAILIGLQASGKTTSYRRHLADTHVHVSKDLFGRSARRGQPRQLRLIAEALAAGRDVAGSSPHKPKTHIGMILWGVSGGAGRGRGVWSVGFIRRW